MDSMARRCPPSRQRIFLSALACLLLTAFFRQRLLAIGDDPFFDMESKDSAKIKTQSSETYLLDHPVMDPESYSRPAKPPSSELVTKPSLSQTEIISSSSSISHSKPTVKETVRPVEPRSPSQGLRKPSTGSKASSRSKKPSSSTSKSSSSRTNTSSSTSKSKLSSSSNRTKTSASKTTIKPTTKPSPSKGVKTASSKTNLMTPAPTLRTLPPTEDVPIQPADPVQTTNNTPSVAGVPDWAKNESDSSFVDQWCQLEGATWYFPPDDHENSWQMRAPRFILPGPPDSGVENVLSTILKHPNIVPTRRQTDVAFFLHFRGFHTKEQKVKVWSARKRLHAGHYNIKRLRRRPHDVSFDATPYYLMAAPPQRILCVAPWIKLVIFLRNPVDRIYASYLTAVQKHRYPHSFTEFVNQDVALLKKSGLIFSNETTWKSSLKFRGSGDEEDAWFRYLELTKQGIIGQSLYELQLRHWFEAIEEMGRDPREAMHFVRYEDWERDPQQEYSKILQFVGLPSQTVEWKNSTLSTLGSKAPSNIKEDEEDAKTRQKLKIFFLPYNRRLYKLLGGDWKNIWNPPLRPKPK